LGKIKVLSSPSHLTFTHTQIFNILFDSFLSYFNSLLVVGVFTLNLKAFGDPIFFQIKPKVGTVCFGVAASQGTLLLAGGEKGMRYSMPNARIVMNQPRCGFGVRNQLLKFCTEDVL
jgi:hypothetical protein